MGLSTCCGAYTDMEEMGICPACRDHCDFEDEEEDEDEQADNQIEQEKINKL